MPRSTASKSWLTFSPARWVIGGWLLSVLGAGGVTPVLAQHGPAHVHSVTGNGPSHSISKIWNNDGTYSINESYINGWTGRRRSRLYTSWDRQWSYSGNPPGGSLFVNQPKPPTWNPQTVRPGESSSIWVRNPYFHPVPRD